MNKENYERIEALFGKENLDHLPVVYRLMEPNASGKGITAAFVESEFHQTKIYKCDLFYKPVSTIVIIKEDANG